MPDNIDLAPWEEEALNAAWQRLLASDKSDPVSDAKALSSIIRKYKTPTKIAGDSHDREATARGG